jgi:hypothetical protein
VMQMGVRSAMMALTGPAGLTGGTVLRNNKVDVRCIILYTLHQSHNIIM